MIGGMRGALAGGCWLRAHRAWEEFDASATLTWIRLAVSADERTLFFWINGSRIIAYDFPAWETAADAPMAVRQNLRMSAAARALRFLEEAQQVHPGSPEIVIEQAMVHWRVRGDLERAAERFRAAATLPGAPYYAARLHAEMLRTLGRNDEALAWLRGILPDLPESDPAACRDAVVQRIKALEAELARP